MSDVVLKNVKKIFNNTTIINDFNLEIKSGEFVVLVGPSGCGKSTILRMIAGLEDITSGSILIENTSVNDTAPSKRGVAMVFQTYALYPHMTVFNNIAFSLKLAKTPKNVISEKVADAAHTLQLTHLLDRLPKQLSGGQRQRVAIGRAIIRNPKVFLFDEPLSNLDASLRIQTRIEIEKLHKQLKTTMVYVTHDQIEAMTLADKVVVLNNGSIAQIGSPTQIYNHPKNKFVASFIGSLRMNFLDALVQDHKVYLGSTMVCTLLSNASEVTVGIRPEHIIITNDSDYLIAGTVDIIEHLGEYKIYYVQTDDYGVITVKDTHNTSHSIGHKIHISFSQHLHIFDASGEAITFII